MLINQATELHLVDLHDCCLMAQEHLIPPHEAGEVEVYAGQKAEFAAMPYWSIAMWGGLGVPVIYCPFCGCLLPLEQDDCSGIDFNRIWDE